MGFNNNLDQKSTTTDKLLFFLSYIIGLFLVLFLLWFAYSYPFSRTRFSNIFLGFGLFLYYIKLIIESKAVEADWDRIITIKSKSIYFFLLAILSIFSCLYIEFHYARFEQSAFIQGYTHLDYLIGGIIIYIVGDSTYRAFGSPIVVVMISTICYAVFGSYLPGIFGHGGFSPFQIAEIGVLNLDGVYGFILGVGVTWVAIFIVFAGMLHQYGAMEFMTKVGNEASAAFRTGIAEFAVIASMIMGSITGSAAANTATTGSFTIPMFKEQGIREDYAAAIEGVASSGGQLLPPIMGVAAFLMADILGIPYLNVIQAAIIPALLFYLSVTFSVYLILIKHGWISDGDGEFRISSLSDGLYYLIPMGVLLYTLIILRLTPLSSGLYTIITTVFVINIDNYVNKGIHVNSLIDSLETTVKGLHRGIMNFTPLIGALASIGFIVMILQQTGLAQEISMNLVAVAGGVLIFLLIFAMIASILFGLGMPTPAAYLLVVILVAPAIIEAGLGELLSHLFVFYFAMLSAITPPVAIAVLIGARIAEADFISSCKQALRIGGVGFLVPFIFAYNPSLIYWSFPTTGIYLSFSIFGILIITCSLIKHNPYRNIGNYEVISYLAVSLVVLFVPSLLIRASITSVFIIYIMQDYFKYSDRDFPRPII